MLQPRGRQPHSQDFASSALFRFFTLTSADVAFIAPVRGRGPADQLALVVALCTLPGQGSAVGVNISVAEGDS